MREIIEVVACMTLIGHRDKKKKKERNVLTSIRVDVPPRLVEDPKRNVHITHILQLILYTSS